MNKKEIKRKEMSMRDMLKITRRLNEENQVTKNIATPFDQEEESRRFKNYIADLNIIPQLIPLVVKPEYVFWGGTIPVGEGAIQFVYKITTNETSNDVEFNYLNNITVDTPDVQEIVNRVEAYYDIFYKYWRENNFENN